MPPEPQSGNVGLPAGGDETLWHPSSASLAVGGLSLSVMCAFGHPDRVRDGSRMRDGLLLDARHGCLRASASWPSGSSAITSARGGQGRHWQRPAPAAARQRRDRVEWAVFRLARHPSAASACSCEATHPSGLAVGIRIVCGSHRRAGRAGARTAGHRRRLRRRRAGPAPRARRTPARARRAPSSRRSTTLPGWRCASLYRRARCAWPAESRGTGFRGTRARGPTTPAAVSHWSRPPRARRWPPSALRRARAPNSSRRCSARCGRDRRRALGWAARALRRAPRQCVSCGLCLPHCPTYDLLAAESDGPRGRIHIMQRLVAGDLTVEERASRSIAASVAAPARRPARRACTTASCSRSPGTEVRKRPRCRFARCCPSSSARGCWPWRCAPDGPSRACCQALRVAAAGRSTPTRPSPGNTATRGDRPPSSCAAASCARPSPLPSRPPSTRWRPPATT